MSSHGHTVCDEDGRVFVALDARAWLEEEQDMGARNVAHSERSSCRGFQKVNLIH
jgi:hypothetical protein